MTATGSTGLGARVSLTGLTKSYGAMTAVAGVDLQIPAGSFTALLGPSGCGKSTLLGLLAGLEAPDAGAIALDDHDITRVRAEDRPVGLVFQKPLLFPHLSVTDNIAFGLRMRRVPRRRARVLVAELLEELGIGGLGGRRVGELSGGQEQRVALARALALRPRLLLLDEPFSQLDPELRTRMRGLVRDLAGREKTTTLFVTHDLAEAVDVADEIVLMLAGRIEGVGRPESFYADPPSLAASRFFEATNEIAGIVTAGVFRAAGLVAPLRLARPCPDGRAVLVVRPEALRLTPAPAARSPLELLAYPLGVRFAGTHRVVELRVDPGPGEKEEGVTVKVQVPNGTVVDESGPLRLFADSYAVFPEAGR